LEIENLKLGFQASSFILNFHPSTEPQGPAFDRASESGLRQSLRVRPSTEPQVRAVKPGFASP